VMVKKLFGIKLVVIVSVNKSVLVRLTLEDKINVAEMLLYTENSMSVQVLRLLK
jgi:hypothetical protein